MKVKRFADAKTYDAPNHRDVHRDCACSARKPAAPPA